jgi:hypothetical protein
MKEFTYVVLMMTMCFIKWLDNEDLNFVKREFERKRSIPQACNTINSIHVEVEFPSHMKSTDHFDNDKE